MATMSSLFDGHVIPSNSGRFSNSSQPYNQMAPSQRSRTPIAAGDADGIMSALRDWTENSQRSPSHAAANILHAYDQNGYDGHEKSNFEIRRISPLERKMTPDLIRINPQNCHKMRDEDQPVINHEPLFLTHYQIQTAPYTENQGASPAESTKSSVRSVTSPRQSTTSSWQSGASSSQSMTYPHQSLTSPVQSPTSGDAYHFSSYVSHRMPGEWHSTFDNLCQFATYKTQDDLYPTASKASQSVGNGTATLTGSPSSHDLYQKSLSEEFCVYKSCGKIEKETSDGFCISNPTYSDSKTLEDVDFYSKENIRSVSQMLIQDQSCLSPTNQSHCRSTPISSKNDGNPEPEHRFSFSLEDVGSQTLSREDNRSRSVGRNTHENELDTRDKMSISSNASPVLYNDRCPVTPHNSFGLSNNAQIQSSLTQNSSSKVSLNDSLLSSPKFRALKQANLSDSAKSSPSLNRKFSPSPCKSSPSLDQESKNSLDSSTLSIATSWSSGVGLPFPRSHSSSFSSQSPSQKFHSGSTENFAARNVATCKWEDISGTRYPLPAPNDSSFGRDTPEDYFFSGQTAENLPSLMKKRGLNSDNLFDHNSDLNCHRSYIHPPLYPLIPRAQRTKGDEDSGGAAALGQDTLSDIHKCCSCSCHANTSESSQRATVSPPFPHLSYDVNNNMTLFYGGNSPQSNKLVSLASIEPVEDATQDSIGQIGKKPSMMKFENHGDHIRNPRRGTTREGQLKLDGTARALGHRERSLSFPTTRSENRYKVGDNLGPIENHQQEQAGNHQQRREETCETVDVGKDTYSSKSFSLSEWSPHHSSRPLLHSDSSQRGRSTGKIQRAPAFRYGSSSLRTGNGLSTSDVVDADIGNRGNSPLKKSNRNRPPVPQRDLSITTSSSWKRSPLQLPPNAALDLPPCATVENVDERRWNTPSGEAGKSGRRSHQDIGSFSEASEDDTGIENMNGVTLYENVTQIDWDKIMNVDQEESRERKLGENDRDGFFNCNGLDEEHGRHASREQPSDSRNDLHSYQMGHHHDTSILKMEHAPRRDFNRCLTLPSTISKLEKPMDVISLADSDNDKMFPLRSPFKNLHIGNRLDDRSGKDFGKHAELTDEENPSVDSVVENTTTTYSVPQELFYKSLEKESHHFDWRASAHHPSTTSHYYKRGTCHPPDVIPSVVVIDSSSDREADGISESIAGENMSKMEENLEDMTPVHRAPSPSEVKGPMQEWVESSVRQLELTEVDSVQQWLFDIRTNTDCESMCILQGKSIHTSPVNLEMTANTIKDNVLKLRTSSRSLLAKFSELHQKLSDGWWNDLWPLCHVVVQEVETVVKECVGFFVEIPQAISTLQQGLQKECSEFKTLVKGLEDSNSNLVQSESLLTNQLVSLGEQCARFVEMVQTKLIQVLVYSVQDSASEFNIMVSVKTVHSLVTDYPSIKQILLREQIANALFQVCLQTSFTVSSLKLLSLQILSKLCQDADGRIEIEKIGGVGYLSQIISSPTSSEALKIETAALIGQLTAPETISEYGQTRIHQHLEVLLKALTELMEQSSDPLVFLVISSAVANLSFMGSVVSDHLARQDAARILVESWRDGKVETLNAKDQLVTIFAIMAENQRCREEIRQSGGISLLVTMLQTQLPEGDIRSEDPNEVNVKLCEQIQQKAAIALARLAKDVNCALEIDACDGIPLVTKICKTSSYRNKSVPVLIACLAALRRLHHALGPSSFQEEDVNKLIRPKMIDSIFTCSSMSEESFV